MKKRIIIFLICLCCLFVSTGIFTACDITKKDGQSAALAKVYGLYVEDAEEKGEKPLTYQEWLVSVRGEKGEKGDAPVVEIIDGYWYIDNANTGIKATGEKGDKGDTGEKGEKGDKGDAPTLNIINGYWYINGVNTGVKATGNKGDKGDKGEKGDSTTIEIIDGYWYINNVNTGVKAIGLKGDKGDKGDATVVEIINGYWYIAGENTGVKAVGEKGDKGDTTTIEIIDDYWYIDGVNTGVSTKVEEVVHDYDVWHTIVKPSCTPGLKARECKDCGYTEVKMIAATHNFEFIEGKEPTCTSKGWEDYKRCKDCGFTDYTEIAPLGHSLSWVIVTDATCTQNGLKQQECANCHAIFNTEVILATGHISDGEKCIKCGLKEFTINVEYKYSTGETAKTKLTQKVWEGESYLIESPVIEGYIADKNVVSGVANSNQTIVVTYSTISLVEIVRLDNVNLGNIDYNTQFTGLGLPSTVKGYTSTGAEVSLKVYWNASSYNPTQYGVQEILGTVVSGYGYAIICSNTVKATLNVSTNVIVSIEAMNLGRLPLNTPYSGLGLPSTAAVKTASGSIYYLPVSWNTYEYDCTIAGAHTIDGTITLEEGFSFADGVLNKATISFELSERMYGTADIVFLVDTTGSMGDEIRNVKNNIVRFADRLEDEGVSVRWALLEYRDITCDGAGSTKVIYCGSSEWYINVASYEKALASLNVTGGGDRAETVIDALKAATYLEARTGAKTFYIVVTDADYKTPNSYGVASMDEMINELVAKDVVTSVVTKLSFFNVYRTLTDRTGGILANIDGNFAEELWKLCDLITEDVVYGEVDHIEIISKPTKLTYVAGDYFDGLGMIVRAYYTSGISRDITGYGVSPYNALQVTDTEIEINYRGKTATIEIEVVAPEVEVERVELSKTSVTLMVGEKITISATVYPLDAVNKKITWNTLNSNIAVVEDGIIEGVGVGQTSIVVISLEGGKTAQISVTVKARPIAVEGIYTNVGAVELLVGDTATIIATVLPTNATNKNLIWTTSSSAIATVNNGVITAVGNGTATITVKTQDGGYIARVLVVVIGQKGNIAGRVYKSNSTTYLAGVTVSLYKTNGTKVTSTTTSSNGDYTFANVYYGNYNIVFEKTGYFDVSTNINLNMTSLQVENIYMVSDGVTLPGKASGKAINASTGSGIASISIYVRSGNNNTTGTILQTLTTSSTGEYITGNLTPGNYTFQFVDNRGNSVVFSTVAINVTIVGDSTSTNNNASMTAPIVDGTIKVVLTWGSSPNDLDSHLLIKNSTTSGHVYYSNKSGNGAVLDVDDTNAYGPETITIDLLSNTNYCYYVYNYSGSSATSISNSGAVVKIYIGSEVYTFNAPSGSGLYWKVFSYNSATGSIVFHNQIVTSAPSL